MKSSTLALAHSAGLDLSGCKTDRKRAVRVHDFVRDRVRFGVTPWFDVADPATTLRLGVGHCNPKATLFVGVLRELGIEARLHFVTITNEVLRGLWPDGAGPPSRLSHAYSEVRLDGSWQRVDSYVVDRALWPGAAARLAEKRWAMGFGVHADGAPDWDGHGDAFSQLADDAMVLEDHGAWEDLRSFATRREYRHRLGPLPFHALMAPLRLLGDRTLSFINHGVEATRSSAPLPETAGSVGAWTAEP